MTEDPTRRGALYALGAAATVLCARNPAFAQQDSASNLDYEPPRFADLQSFRAKHGALRVAPNSLVSISAPQVALAGRLDLGLLFDGPWVDTLAVFAKNVQRTASVKFEGSEPCIFAARLSPRARPAVTYPFQLSATTRMLVAAVSAGQLHWAEHEIQLAERVRRG